MSHLNTPVERFDNLHGYPFSAHYIDIGSGMKMHYLDEGEGPVIILLHGEPSWSYLYRKMIPVLTSAGYRCLVPDLIGFGKSSKSTAREDYTYHNHMLWLQQWLDAMELANFHLFLQDWGGLLGLRIAIDNQEKVSTITLANTFLPAGNKPNEAFIQWKKFSQTNEKFDIGSIIQRGTVTDLDPEVIRAYNAPYPNETYKVGARQFPMIVPFGEEPESMNNIEYWKQLVQWEKPVLTLFSDKDFISMGLEQLFIDRIPGCRDQPHEIIKDAGHFLQEDKGKEIAQKMVDWYRGMPA